MNPSKEIMHVYRTSMDEINRHDKALRRLCVILAYLFGILTGMFLAGAVFQLDAFGQELGDNLCADLNPIPPAGTMEAGYYVTPPYGDTLDLGVAADGKTGTMTFSKFSMVMAWSEDPPWYLANDGWYDERFWWITEDGPDAYCRSSCENRNTDPAEDSDWLCRSECITIRSADYRYQRAESTDCGDTWAVVEDHVLEKFPAVASTRRAARRLRPGG